MLSLSVEQAAALNDRFSQYDSVDAQTLAAYVPFHLYADREPPNGYLSQQIVDAIFEDNAKETKACFRIDYDTDERPCKISIAHWLVEQGPEAISQQLHRLCRGWYERGTPVSERRDEPHTVYDDRGPAFELERGCLRQFGVQVYGVSAIGYVRDAQTGAISCWIGKRAADLLHEPGKLDFTASGGLKAGHTCMQGICEEAEEEASLPFAWSLSNMKPDGHFFMTEEYTSKLGLPCIRPHVEHMYELRFRRGDPVPHPNDGSVEAFRLIPEHELLELIVEGGSLASWCDLVYLDFLDRKGRLDISSHSALVKTISRMRKRSSIAGPM